MEWSEDIIKKTESFGILGYEIQRCLIIIDFDDPSVSAQYERDFKDKLSPIYKTYHKGVVKNEFAIDKKLSEMAHAGDMKAIQELDKRKRARRFN